MKVKLVGDRELAKALLGLPDRLDDTALQKANSKAAQPLVDRMHRLSPVGLTGNLADSIGIVKAGKKNKSELGLITIGPRRKGGFKGFAGHLVEFGTKRRTTKSGANRGVMPKEPFVEPAWEQTKDEVLGSIDKELEKVVTSYWKRTVKR